MVAEHDNDKILPITRNTITAAGKVGGDISLLVAGENCAKVSFLLNALLKVENLKTIIKKLNEIWILISFSLFRC